MRSVLLSGKCEEVIVYNDAWINPCLVDEVHYSIQPKTRTVVERTLTIGQRRFFRYRYLI